MPKITDDIIDKLSNDISDEVGAQHDPELDIISNDFSDMLTKVLKSFNSTVFDDDGFISKIRDIDLGGIDRKDRDTIKNILNSLQSEYINPETHNQSEMLLRRDIKNICAQMPEMRDAVYATRDAIIECNVATGQVSRSLIFKDREQTESDETSVQNMEELHDFATATKNYIVPNTLESGELYVHVKPYSKLFAELEQLNSMAASKNGRNKRNQGNVKTGVIHESTANLATEANIKILMESTSNITKIDASDITKIDTNTDRIDPSEVTKGNIKHLLENIDVYNDSSIAMAEMGPDGLKDFLIRETAGRTTGTRSTTPETHFMETMAGGKVHASLYNKIDQDDVDYSKYKDVKGCYIKYLDPLKVIPVRMDKHVIGYYYISTSVDILSKPAAPSGVVDLSYQEYTNDRNLVGNLANIIIQSFDKKMLDKNIKLKNEIVEIIMAHKFSDGKLTFIYIPEDEVVRFVINEDENGKGHSMIEPGIFPARMYLLLTLYNMLYTLNNNTTRIHYLKSSGLDKNYSAQVQRAIRKFQSRRITMNDVFSYTAALTKIGGMGEMVLPAGRGDYKAFETDTIEAVQNPIDVNFLEQQRRQALSATGVPQLLVINALDEVDFAKTLELANARFLSAVSSYKIDFNKGMTKLYQMVLTHETKMDPEVIKSFRFKFDNVKQQDLNITSEMIANFNTVVDLVQSLYYREDEIKDDKDKPTSKMMHLRLELAKEYLPQLNFDKLKEIVDRVNVDSNNDMIKDKAHNAKIDDKDLKDIES